MTINGDKISALTTGTPLDTDWIPYVDIVAGETKKATKTDLKGSKGDTGATGPKGDTGATGPKGDIGITRQGDYNDTTQYYTNDGVSYDGSSYIAIQNTKGNNPTDTDYWDLVAKKGENGDGSGDMLKSTYDPNLVEADAFSQDNMENGTTNVNYTKTEQDKLSGIADGANVNVQTDWNETDNAKDDYLKNKPDLTVYEVTSNKVTAFQSTPDDTHYISEKLAKDSLDNKEDAFTKNTAFNKDFGTASGDVMEGDTDVGIVGTKIVDETNIADGTIIQYDKTNDKYVCVVPATGGGGGIETLMIAGDQSAGTYYFELDTDSDRHIGNVVIALQVANTGADFIVKCYKNGTDLSKDITIADGGGTAVNGRYKASLDVNEDLAADDVFELEIYQVGSDQPGSGFSSLINIT